MWSAATSDLQTTFRLVFLNYSVNTVGMSGKDTPQIRQDTPQIRQDTVQRAPGT